MWTLGSFQQIKSSQSSCYRLLAVQPFHKNGQASHPCAQHSETFLSPWMFHRILAACGREDVQRTETKRPVDSFVRWALGRFTRVEPSWWMSVWSGPLRLLSRLHHNVRLYFSAESTWIKLCCQGSEADHPSGHRAFLSGLAQIIGPFHSTTARGVFSGAATASPQRSNVFSPLNQLWTGQRNTSNGAGRGGSQFRREFTLLFILRTSLF